jgi:hypothetical protein
MAKTDPRHHPDLPEPSLIGCQENSTRKAQLRCLNENRGASVLHHYKRNPNVPWPLETQEKGRPGTVEGIVACISVWLMSAEAGSGATFPFACITLLLPLVTLTPFCLGPVLARALASHNHELNHGFACSCPSALFIYESSSTCPCSCPKVPHMPVSIPISYLSHELHLHLTPIAPCQNFMVACGLTLLIACLPAPAHM